MLIKLKAGEHLWNYKGAHVCDEKGFAVILEQDTEVEMEDGAALSALKVIKADREFRGCDPETGEPLPKPVTE